MSKFRASHLSPLAEPVMRMKAASGLSIDLTTKDRSPLPHAPKTLKCIYTYMEKE